MGFHRGRVVVTAKHDCTISGGYRAVMSLVSGRRRFNEA